MTGVSTNTAHGRVVAAAATRAASALLDLDFALVDPTGGVDVGRLDVDYGDEEIFLLLIELLPNHRGQGLA
jgi:hypothetical protein